MKYVINWIDGEYVDITITINGKEYNQNLCGMPTDNADLLKERIEQYVKKYQEDLTYEPESSAILSQDVEALIGKEQAVDEVVLMNRDTKPASVTSEEL